MTVLLIALFSCGFGWLFYMWTMLNELQQFTRDDDFKPWFIIVPFLNYYFLWVKVPEQVAKAKQMAGWRNPQPQGFSSTSCSLRTRSRRTSTRSGIPTSSSNAVSAIAGRALALGAARALGRAARVAAAGTVFAVLFALHVPLCPFALVTHRPCPGCGMGRATLALLDGRLGDAFAAHPLAPIVSPLAIAALALNAFTYVRHGRWGAVELLRGRVATVAVQVLFVSAIAVWVARFFGFFGGPVAV